jgi:hypothetical protein
VGGDVEAALAIERALLLAPSEVERRYLPGRLQEAGTGDGGHDALP